MPRIAAGTEGALGRPISGTSVAPDVGVVPPEPVWAVNLSEIYFHGSIGASREVPIAGQAALGIDSTVWFTLATVLKVWDTGPGDWNFASSITVPYMYAKVSAILDVGALRPVSETQSASNLFDLYFTPVVAGYHISKDENFSLSFNVWAPTGKYDPTLLANPSLNNWTFIPAVAYTKALPAVGLEFDATAGVQFYTKNSATDYQNAPLFTLDLMGLKRFDNGAGIGLIVGTVQQLGKDTGPTADKLNGFVGYDVGVGPILTYDTKLDGKAPLSFTLRWVTTVASKNRVSGDAVMATATLIF